MDEFKPAPVKANVSVAELEKLDIRVGTIGLVPALCIPERSVPNGARAG